MVSKGNTLKNQAELVIKDFFKRTTYGFKVVFIAVKPSH